VKRRWRASALPANPPWLCTTRFNTARLVRTWEPER